MRERLARMAPVMARRPAPAAIGRVYRRGSSTFTAPTSDRFTFAIWGPSCAGDGSSKGGASGGLSIITKRLSKGQTVAIVVGETTDSTLTFPDGTVVTAAAAADVDTAGTASGGDINVSGATSGVGSGAAAASYGPYQGGDATSSGARVGHGVGGNSAAGTRAHGLCFVHSGPRTS